MSVAAVATAIPRPRSIRPGLALAVAVVVVAVAWAVLPGVFAPHDPLAADTSLRLQPPSAAHPFGTDILGRDLLSRVIHGSSLSLSGAALAVTLGLVVGFLLGLVAGYLGGTVDTLLMRAVDVILAIPGLLLMMAIVVAFGFGTVNAAVAVGIASIATFARLARSEVIRVKALDFVEAARGSGVPVAGVMVRHLIPNAAGPALALAALQFGAAILAIATLGFLGFGTPPPTPEWGLLVAEGRDYISLAWWLTVLPGLVIVVVVLSAGRLSAELRRRI